MKNLFLSIFAIALSFGVFAQDTTSTKTPVITEQTQSKDVYVMKDNKMWVVKDNQKTEMAKDVTLVNGITIKTNGSLVTSVGQKMALKDGQYIDQDGKIGDWKQSN